MTAPSAHRVAHPHALVTDPTRPGVTGLLATRTGQAAVALIVGQLVYRGWITYPSWYALDDFSFMSRMLNEGLRPSVALEQYAGHLMPAGMYLSWLAPTIAPYDFRVTATMLLSMQALANVGLLMLLVRLFGLRPGILPPLCVYLFCPISVQGAIWWASGVNQLPLQVVLFWALLSHVDYLRTRRIRHVAATSAWLVAGLAFFEKTLLVFGAIAILTLAYYATGSLRGRVRSVWSEFRPAVLTYVLLGGLYLAYYTAYGLTFSPSGATANRDTLLEVMSNMVFQVYLPSVFGGPLHWEKLDPWIYASPGAPMTILAALLAGSLVAAIRSSRERSLRAWWFVAFFLGSNIVLVMAGRASYVGALISLDYRFQGELAAVTAVALACAVMPIIGAPEQVSMRRPGGFLDRPRLVTMAVAVTSILGLVSSTQYASRVQESQPGKQYFANLLEPLRESSSPVALVDSTVPPEIMWGLGYPDNTLSHLLAPFADRLDFRSSAVDNLMMADQDGTLREVTLKPTRWAEPGPRAGCGWQIYRRPTEIPLDGPVAFGGFWVRIGYLASRQTPAVVVAGSRTYDVILPAGLHALYVEADGEFDSIALSRDTRGAIFCTDDITVGRPIVSEAAQ